jgi:hypothetical protein
VRARANRLLNRCLAHRLGESLISPLLLTPQATFPDWFLGLVAVLVFLMHIVGILVDSNVRSYMRKNHVELVKDLPDIADSSTLLGLVFAALAVIASSASGKEGERYYVAIWFLSATSIFLFLHIVSSRLSKPWPAFISLASVVSVWYCLAFSVFSLVYTQLPPGRGSILCIALLLAPVSLIFYTVANLETMCHKERERQTGELMPKICFCPNGCQNFNCRVHHRKCPKCGATAV